MIGELGALMLVVVTVGATWATLLMYCLGYFIVPTTVKARCDGKEGRIPSVELESKRSSLREVSERPCVCTSAGGERFHTSRHCVHLTFAKKVERINLCATCQK